MLTRHFKNLQYGTNVIFVKPGGYALVRDTLGFAEPFADTGRPFYVIGLSNEGKAICTNYLTCCRPYDNAPAVALTEYLVRFPDFRLTEYTIVRSYADAYTSEANEYFPVLALGPDYTQDQGFNIKPWETVAVYGNTAIVFLWDTRVFLRTIQISELPDVKYLVLANDSSLPINFGDNKELAKSFNERSWTKHSIKL